MKIPCGGGLASVPLPWNVTMSPAEDPLSLGSYQVFFLWGGGKGRFRWAAFPEGQFFSRGDGLPRSPTRHNGVLYLQDGLFAHSNCLGCYSSRMVQGSVCSLGVLSAQVIGSPPASCSGVSVVVGRLPARVTFSW